MSDQLEEFIKKNRSEFDLFEPPQNVWKRVDKELSKGKRIKFLRYTGIAASFLILVCAGYFFGLQQGSSDLDKRLFASETQYEEFKEAKQYFTKTISNKITEAENLDVDEDVWADLQQLDEVYNELREEMLMSEFKDKEALVDLMINNYRTKIEILERIIERTKNAQQSKNLKDETINI